MEGAHAWGPPTASPPAVGSSTATNQPVLGVRAPLRVVAAHGGSAVRSPARRWAQPHATSGRQPRARRRLVRRVPLRPGAILTPRKVRTAGRRDRVDRLFCRRDRHGIRPAAASRQARQHVVPHVRHARGRVLGSCCALGRNESVGHRLDLVQLRSRSSARSARSASRIDAGQFGCARRATKERILSGTRVVYDVDDGRRHLADRRGWVTSGDALNHSRLRRLGFLVTCVVVGFAPWRAGSAPSGRRERHRIPGAT